MNKYYYDDKFFYNIDNELKAYWLGFIMADGYIEKIKKNNKVSAMRLEIGISSKDEEMLERFLLDIKSNAKIFNKKVKSHDVSLLRINNTNMCRDLERLGCVNNKSLILNFPTQYISKELVRHFIRGYFDGDGCVSYYERDYIDKRNNKQYRQKNFIASFIGTEQFLTELNDVLSEIGIKCNNITHGNCGNAYELKITNIPSLKLFYDYIYEDCIICLNRKNLKFNMAFENYNI